MSADSRLEIILAAKDISGRTMTAFQKRVDAITSSVFSLQGGLAAVGFGGFVFEMNRAADAAGDFSETFSKVNTLFGPEESRKLDAWGDAAEKAMGLSSRAALDAVGSVGNMFQQLGAADDQAIRLSQTMVQMSADLASFHNVAGGSVDVLEAMQSAFRGEYDALQRYIPTINAAAVQEQALADTHKKSTKELTDLEKALAAYKIIMQDAGAATGDFARTSAGLANQERILGANIDNLTKRIGKSLLPVKTDIVTKTNEWIDANEDLIAQKVPEYVDATAEAAENLFTKLQTGVSIYESLPDEVVGAAGAGILGRVLFGGWGPAKIVAGVYMINEALGNLDKTIAQMPANLGQFAKSYGELVTIFERIGEVFSGQRNWNTGRLQGASADRFNLGIAARQSLAQQAQESEYSYAYGGTMDAHVRAWLNRKNSADGGSLPNDFTGGGLSSSGIYANAPSIGSVNDPSQLPRAFENPYAHAAVQAETAYTHIGETMYAHVQAWQEHNASLVELSERTAWSMQENFSTFFFDAMQGELQSFSDYFDSIFTSINRSVADFLGQGVTQKLFGKDFSGGGLLSNLFNFEGRASGGNVYPGQTVWVGERGPELFTAGRSGGYVTANSQLQPNITFNIDNRSGVNVEQSDVQVIQPRPGQIAANLVLKERRFNRYTRQALLGGR